VKTLVTGGSGFIGSHVIDHLTAAGHEVVVLDTRPPHRLDATFREGDVNDLPTVIRATAGVDAIFHLAAVSNVDDARADPVGTMELNVVGTARVCEAAKRNQVGRVILASTVWAYASAAETPGGILTEETPVSTVGTGHVYTASKVASELVVTSFGELYDMPYTILRYGIPFGPRMREQLVIARFVRNAANGTPITIHGDGSQYRNYVYVEDLADAHVRVLKDDASVNQTINLEGPAPVTIREIAEVVRDLVNPSMQIEFISARPGDFTGRPVSASKAEEVLGWKATTSFEDGMRKYVEWWFAEEQEPRASRG
jgi:UDP-glucose 4-epimerase